MGIKYTQHKDISWSKRYRGKVALIHTKKMIWNRSFIEKEIDDINPKILKGPPKKEIEVIVDSEVILAYSAIKNNEKITPLYSIF